MFLFFTVSSLISFCAIAELALNEDTYYTEEFSYPVENQVSPSDEYTDTTSTTYPPIYPSDTNDTGIYGNDDKLESVENFYNTDSQSE